MSQITTPTFDVQAAQVARAQRAQDQAGDFLIFPDVDDEFTFHCLNRKSGGSYRVGPDSCSCPDHARRGAHVTCKHRLAVAEHIRGLVRQMEERKAAQEREAAAARMVDGPAKPARRQLTPVEAEALKALWD